MLSKRTKLKRQAGLNAVYWSSVIVVANVEFLPSWSTKLQIALAVLVTLMCVKSWLPSRFIDACNEVPAYEQALLKRLFAPIKQLWHHPVSCLLTVVSLACFGIALIETQVLFGTAPNSRIGTTDGSQGTAIIIILVVIGLAAFAELMNRAPSTLEDTTA